MGMVLCKVFSGMVLGKNALARWCYDRRKGGAALAGAPKERRQGS